jgi:hypothetical protein
MRTKSASRRTILFCILFRWPHSLSNHPLCHSRWCISSIRTLTHSHIHPSPPLVHALSVTWVRAPYSADLTTKSANRRTISFALMRHTAAQKERRRTRNTKAHQAHRQAGRHTQVETHAGTKRGHHAPALALLRSSSQALRRGADAAEDASTQSWVRPVLSCVAWAGEAAATSGHAATAMQRAHGH